MIRIAWLTDIHLNFVKPHLIDDFLLQLREAADIVLISGDIGEGRDVVAYLARIDEVLQRPVYFVLGNHDFYFGSIADVRRRVAKVCQDRPNLRYLTTSPPVQLAPAVGLVGHDGWADGRIGNYERSYVMMNDYKLIKELAGVGKRERWPLLKALGDAAAVHIRDVLPQALQAFPRVFLVTHVPPLREACWHEGKISDDEWAPHFTCQAMGDAILEVMHDHPENELTVLCGHTHGTGETQPLKNVRILTGGATYGQPEIKQVFEL